MQQPPLPLAESCLQNESLQNFLCKDLGSDVRQIGLDKYFLPSLNGFTMKRARRIIVHLQHIIIWITCPFPQKLLLHIMESASNAQLFWGQTGHSSNEKENTHYPTSFPIFLIEINPKLKQIL